MFNGRTCIKHIEMSAQMSGNFQIPKTGTVNIVFGSDYQRSYINDGLCKRLKPPVIKEKVIIKVFGNAHSKLCNADAIPVQFVVSQRVVVIEC